MPRNLFNGLSLSQNTSWKDLGTIGNHQINKEEILQHTDLTKQPHKTKCNKPRIVNFSNTVDNFTQEIINKGCAHLTTKPITCTYFFTPKPNSDKVRAICDARHHNNTQQSPPKPVKLPCFNDIKEKIRNNPRLYFTVVDISNFFWSLKLPPEWHNNFIYGYFKNGKEIRVALTRVPFGWNYSPIVCQTVLQNIYNKIRKETIQPSMLETIQEEYIYIDDILTFSTEAQPLEEYTLKRNEKLKLEHLFQNEAKSDHQPKTSVKWTGKQITANETEKHIKNTIPHTAQAIASTILTTAATAHQKQLQRITGSLIWLGIHNRTNLPYLFRINNHITKHKHKKLDNKTTRDTILAAITTLTPWTPKDLTWTPPDANHNTFFVDATISIGAFINTHTQTFTNFNIPNKYRNQQNAELYTITKTIQENYHTDSTINIISDSAPSIFSIIKMSCGSKNWKRNRLLKKLSKIIQQNKTKINISFIRTQHNPADKYSRMTTTAPSQIDTLTQTNINNILTDINKYIYDTQETYTRETSQQAVQQDITHTHTHTQSKKKLLDQTTKTN